MGDAAIAALTDAFETTFAQAGAAADAATVVVTSWPSVPVEVIRAAGLRPVVARGTGDTTPTAEATIEPDIFPSRLRQLFEQALGGRLSSVSAIVVSRTSDPDYKAFLYLREMARSGAGPALPRTLLFDLLQSNTTDVTAYDRARTRALAAEFGSVTAETLRLEIARANSARAAVRRLLALRQGHPRVSGAEALPLVGAFWQMDPERYTALANEAADTLEAREPLAGPRLLLAGAPVDGNSLHTAVEATGAIVVAESSPWGSGAAGSDVAPSDDPFDAIADKYRRDSVGTRLPVADTRAWLDRLSADVEGVVVSLPPDDAVFGWDYPALGEALAARKVPHTCLFGDPYAPLGAEDQERLATLVAATRQREVSPRG